MLFSGPISSFVLAAFLFSLQWPIDAVVRKRIDAPIGENDVVVARVNKGAEVFDYYAKVIGVDQRNLFVVKFFAYLHPMEFLPNVRGSQVGGFAEKMLRRVYVTLPGALLKKGDLAIATSISSPKVYPPLLVRIKGARSSFQEKDDSWIYIVERVSDPESATTFQVADSFAYDKVLGFQKSNEPGFGTGDLVVDTISNNAWYVLGQTSDGTLALCDESQKKFSLQNKSSLSPVKTSLANPMALTEEEERRQLLNLDLENPTLVTE